MNANVHSTMRISVVALLLLLGTGAVSVPPPNRALAQRAGQSAWFGFSIQCSNCRSIDGPTGHTWEFTSPPEIVAVEARSPADVAGLVAGDVLTHVDGIPLTTPRGSSRLADARPADTLVFTYRRGALIRQATIRAGRPPEPPQIAQQRPSVPTAPPPKRDVSFSGSFGNVGIVVRGSATVMVAEHECWMEIRSADAVIHLSTRAGCASSTAPSR